MLNTEDEQVFRVGTQVEISSNEKGFKNCWYKCTIIDRPKSHSMQKRRKRKNYYWVEYQNIVEEEDQSKALREYVEASFIRPLRPETSSACTQNLKMFDVVEASYREGWWVGVVVKVMNDGLQYVVAFVNPYEKIVFSRDKLRHHLTWLGGDQWILLPRKNDVPCPQDVNGTVRASQVESILEQVKARAKRLKQASSNVEAPPSQSCGSSSSEGNISITSPQRAAQNVCTVNNRKITHCINSVLEGKHLSTTLCLNRPDPVRLLAENRKKIKLGYNKKMDGQSYKKEMRDCPPKKPVQRVLRFLQPGVGEQPGESDARHESAFEQSPTSETAGSHCRSLTTEDLVTEKVDLMNDVMEIFDEQGGCQTLALYSNPGLTERSKPHLATPCVNSQSDKSQSWPFTKRSGMWKVIESMEVFQRSPQMPHFSPLKEQGDNWREMSAMCIMAKFAYEVERITTGSLQNSNIIDECLNNLKELELHGFRTIQFQIYLKELLENIGAEKELQEKLERTVSGIRKCQAEKTEAQRKISEVDEQIKSLQEQIKYSESVKYLKEQQLAKMESVKGIISSELHHLRLAKKRPLMPI